MGTLTRSLAAVALLLAGAAGIGSASAAPFTAPAAAPGIDSAVQQVDYIYGGRRHCWYYDGWHGPGWYWCGYRWRRGLGWGSPVWGWNNWAWSGPRYYRRGPAVRHFHHRGGPGIRHYEHRRIRRW